MEENNEYASNVYKTIKANVPDFSFAENEQGFYDKMKSDSTYASNVYKTINSNLDDFSFKDNEKGFLDAVGYKTKIEQPKSAPSGFAADMQQAVQPKSIMADGSVPQPIESMPKEIKVKPTDGTPLEFQWSGGKSTQTIKGGTTAAMPEMNTKEESLVPEHLKKMEAIDNAFKEKVRKQNAPRDLAINTNFSIPQQLVMGFVQGVTPAVSETARSIAIMANQLDDAENNWFNDGNDKKVTDYATYKFAESVDKFTNDLPINSELKQSLAGQLATGAGNLAGFAGAGVAGKSIKGLSVFGKYTPEVVAGLSGAFQQGGSEYKAAYEKIVDAQELSDEEYLNKYSQENSQPQQLIQEKNVLAKHDAENDAFGVFLINSVIGTSDALPIGSWLGRLEKATGGLISKNIKKVVMNGAVEGAIEEGVQEAFQQAGTNFTAQQTYDKTREILDGVLESATIGGILGGTLNGLTLMIKTNTQNAKTEEDKNLNEAALGLVQKVANQTKGVANDDIISGNINSDEVIELEKQKQAVEKDMTNPEIDAVTQNLLFEQAQEIQQQIDVEKSNVSENEIAENQAIYKESVAENLEKTAENPNLSETVKANLLAKAKSIRNEINKLYSGDNKNIPTEEQASTVVEGSGGVGGDVEGTAKALEEVAKTKPTLWEKIKEAVKNVGKKLGIISNADHINNFNTAKAEWDKLSSREKKLKRADYELDDLHHTEGGYYKVGNSLIDLDLNSNHLKLLLENNKFLNVLNKLGVTKIHGENRPAEEMFAHYSDGKIHLNNNSAFENIRQVTNAMSHELGHHEWTKLTKEERDYVRSLPLETGMAKHYEAQEKSGKGKETSASLQEENFADYVMQYFQGKLYGDEALLNKIPTKLRELFDNKYSDLLKDNEHSEIAEAYHKAKADGTNPELVKAVEQSLKEQTKVETVKQEIKKENEAKKADIERRRQEELNRDENIEMLYPIQTEEYLTRDDKERIARNEQDKKQREKNRNEINAKYDAELKAVEQTATPKTEQENANNTGDSDIQGQKDNAGEVIADKASENESSDKRDGNVVGVGGEINTENGTSESGTPSEVEISGQGVADTESGKTATEPQEAQSGGNEDEVTPQEGNDVVKILDGLDSDIKKADTEINEDSQLNYYNDSTTMSSTIGNDAVKAKEKIRNIYKPIIDKIKERNGGKTIILYRNQEDVIKENGQRNDSVLSFTLDKQIAQNWANQRSADSHLVEVEVPYENIISVKLHLGQKEFIVENSGIVKESVDEARKKTKDQSLLKKGNDVDVTKQNENGTTAEANQSIQQNDSKSKEQGDKAGIPQGSESDSGGGSKDTPAVLETPAKSEAVNSGNNSTNTQDDGKNQSSKSGKEAEKGLLNESGEANASPDLKAKKKAEQKALAESILNDTKQSTETKGESESVVAEKVEVQAEKPSIAEIKSKVIKKAPEAKASAKKEGVTLKVQKADLLNQIEKARKAFDEGGIDEVKKQGFETTETVEKYYEGTRTRQEAGIPQVIFEVEGDGTFHLEINSLKQAYEQVEKHWSTNETPKNSTSTGNRMPNQVSQGNYDTLANAKDSLQDAIDNLETAKKSTKKDAAIPFEKQLKIEKAEYDNALSLNRSQKEQVAETKTEKIDDIYSVKRQLRLNELEKSVAEFEGTEYKPTKIDYDLIQKVLESELEKATKEVERAKEGNTKKDGTLKPSIPNSKLYSIQGFERKLKTVKETINEVKVTTDLAKAKHDFKVASARANFGGLSALPEFAKLVKAHIAKWGYNLKEFIRDFRATFADSKATDEEIKQAFKVSHLAAKIEQMTESGVEIENAKEVIKESGRYTTKELNDAIGLATGVQNDEPFEQQAGKKSLLGRAHEGKTPQQLKDKLAELGLNYKVENDNEAIKLADAYIDYAGIESVLEQVRDGRITGAAASIVWGRAIDAVYSEYQEAETDEQREILAAKQATMLAEFDDLMRDKGRAINALKAVYRMSPLGYKMYAIKKIESANQEQLDKQKEKLDELEKQVMEAKFDSAEMLAQNVELQAKLDALQGNKPKSTLTPEKAGRKAELKSKLSGRYNDITSFATIWADKEAVEYSKLVIEESAGEFKLFAKDLLKTLGKNVKQHLPELYRRLGGKGTITYEPKEALIKKIKANTKGASEAASKQAIDNLGKSNNGLWGQHKEAVAERLAERAAFGQMESDVKEKPILKDFVDGLVKNILGMMPTTERAETSKKPAFEIIADSLKNREKYQEALDATKEKLQEKFDPTEEGISDEERGKRIDALNAIDSYFGELYDTPFSEKLATESVKDGLKDLYGDNVNKKLIELAKEYFEATNKAKGELVDHLVKKTGLDEATVRPYADAIQEVYDKILNKKVLNQIEKTYPLPKVVGKKTAHKEYQRIVQAINVGLKTGLRQDGTPFDFEREFYKKFGLVDVNEPDVRKKLDEFAKEIYENRNADNPLFQNIATIKMLDWIANRQKENKLALGLTEQIYANMLYGEDTHIRNSEFNMQVVVSAMAHMMAQNPKYASVVRKAFAHDWDRGVKEMISILKTGMPKSGSEPKSRQFSERAGEINSFLDKWGAYANKPSRLLSAFDALQNFPLRKARTAYILVDEMQKLHPTKSKQEIKSIVNDILYGNDAQQLEFANTAETQVQKYYNLTEPLFINGERNPAYKDKAYNEAYRNYHRSVYNLQENNLNNDSVFEEAKDFADTRLLMSRPKGWFGAAATVVNMVGQFSPLTRVLTTPFVNVPFNIAAHLFEFSPLGYATVLARQEGKGINETVAKMHNVATTYSERRRKDLVWKATAGSLGMMAVAALTQIKYHDDDEDKERPILIVMADGTGSYSKNKSLEALKGSEKFQEYTVDFMGKRMSYKYSPFASWFLPSGYLMDAERFGNPTDAYSKERIELYAKAFTGFALFMKDQSSISGMASLFNLGERSYTYKDNMPMSEKLKQAAIEFGSTGLRSLTIPNTIPQTYRHYKGFMDLQENKPEGFLEKLGRDLPFFDQFVGKRFDHFGQPIDAKWKVPGLYNEPLKDNDIYQMMYNHGYIDKLRYYTDKTIVDINGNPQTLTPTQVSKIDLDRNKIAGEEIKSRMYNRGDNVTYVDDLIGKERVAVPIYPALNTLKNDTNFAEQVNDIYSRSLKKAILKMFPLDTASRNANLRMGIKNKIAKENDVINSKSNNLKK